MWPELFEDNCDFEENRALDILDEQVTAINNKTNGRIKGLVTEIKYTDNIPGLTSAMNTFVKLLSVSNIQRQEVLEEELDSKVDINHLYQTTPYKFEIFSDSFRFRILVLINRTDFPIQITLDEGISQELKIDKHKLIESNSQFEEVLSSILGSSKMRSILNRMLNYQESEIENRILSVLKEHKDISFLDLSRKVKMTRASTLIILNKMVEKGLLQETTENKKRRWHIVDEKTEN